MKVGVYVSNNATSIKKALIFMEAHHPGLLRNISFILIDNKKNIELRSLAQSFNFKIYEESLDGVEKKNIYISNKLMFHAVEHGVDYIFLFCDKIIKGEILTTFKNRIINFHPSVLPSFKGLNAIDQAVLSNSIVLGNTAHFIDERVDEGILIMHSFIAREDFKGYADVLNMQIYMFVQILEWLQQERIVISQGRAKVLGACYKIDSYVPNLENGIIQYEVLDKF